jgi:hypothetical protein
LYINHGQKKLYRTKTFFPSNWSVTDILNKAQEALTNTLICPEYTSNGQYEIEGKTNCGVTIQFIVDCAGNIISFYATK